MRIGEIAKRTGLNISNIRFYERKGLLAPKREQDSQYRDYTEEDVLQVKTILLYRKMGIPIETVYLLLHGQADLKEVLFRQQVALQEEIENLNGSLQLCQMLLQEEHPKLESAQIETYLNYVQEEEEKDVRFACVSELMEDMSAYTRDVAFRGESFWHWMYQHQKGSVLFSIFFWGIALICPVMHIVKVASGKATLNIWLLGMYLVIIGIYACGFVRFRKAKRKYIQRARTLGEGEDR